MKLGEEPDEYVIQRVLEALAADERVGELNIDVEIAGGELFLRGLVPSAERRAAIGRVANEIVPSDRVHNDIDLENLSAPGSPERLS